LRTAGNSISLWRTQKNNHNESETVTTPPDETAFSERLYCRIGDLLLDERTGTLSRGGETIELPRLSFTLLAALARAAPALLSVQQLVADVWHSHYVSDETVQQRIKLLRQALDDNPRTPRYIATVRGMGYRLVAEVCHEPPPVLTRRRRWQLSAATAALLAAALVLPWLLSGGERHDHRSGQDEREWTAHSEHHQARDFYFNGKDYANRGTDPDNEAAIRQFQHALDLDPEYALALAGLSHAYAARAVNFNRGSQWLPQAQALAERAVELRPDLARSHLSLAIAHHVQGHSHRALSSYRQVLALEPEHHRALNNAAVIARDLGQLDEALRLGLLAVQASPRQAGGYQRVAEVFSQAGLLELSEVWFRQALIKAPQNQQLQYQLCALHISRGALEEANASCSEMMSWAPEDAWGYEWVGELKLLSGKREEAIALYRTAQQLGSNYSRFRYASLVAEDFLPAEDAQPVDLQQELEQALAVMEAHQQRNPQDHGALLNLLEYHSALGQQEQAYRWLRTLLAAGYTDVGYLRHNSCLAGLQHEPEFQNLLAEFAAARQRMQEMIPSEWRIQPTAISQLENF
jgi:DNA-binding winged helix-turn-helix (wHTH) protein/Flp pilus assembly protein TadD